jgi:hypothetical protein
MNVMIENGNITGYKIAAKETFVTFCGMVGLQAKVLGRLGKKPSPHPRACALSCPSPFAGRGFRAPAFIVLSDLRV